MTSLARTVGGGRSSLLKDVSLPPNFVFIMTDDERFDWVTGVQLATRSVLQNRFITQGCQFRNCRGAYNICAPSRANIMSEGQYYWNNNIHNENQVPQFDFTRDIFTDLWGTAGARRMQIGGFGKILNGWGDPNVWPVPPNQMLNSFDEFGGFVNNLGIPRGSAITHLTNGSAVITSAGAGWVAADKNADINASVQGLAPGTHVLAPGRMSAADTHLTNGSNAVSSVTAAFTGGDVGRVVLASVSGLPAGTTITAVADAQNATLSANFTGTTTLVAALTIIDGTTATLGSAFTGTTTTTAQLYIGSGLSEGSKGKYGAYEEAFDAAGNSLGNDAFQANYSVSNPSSFGDYTTDYLRNKAITFLGNACNRPNGDARQGLPFFLYITPTSGHTPFQDPPVYTPDSTNRAARIAQYNSFVRDLYDTSTADGGTAQTVSTQSVTDESGTWTAQYLEDTTKNWTVDQWRWCVVKSGTAMGIVLSNTPTRLIVGEWLLQGSGSVIYDDANTQLSAASDLNWNTTSAPAAGSYTIVRARPDIDQTDVANVAGTGVFGSNPGGNVKDERNTGHEMVSVDDMIESICQFLENQTGQYSIENTYFIYTADNSIVRGEKGCIANKGFPPDANFRLPFLIRGPGIAAGTHVDFHMHTGDIGATIMGLLGMTGIMSRTTDGIDLSPYLKGEQPWSNIKNRAFVFNGNPPASTKGVITSRYRYYHDTTPPPNMPSDYLFDWKRDPLELRNLYGVGGTGALGDNLTNVQNDLFYWVNLRVDSGAHISINSPVVTDASILASDKGKQVSGSVAGIPGNTFVGTVSAGSFRLSSSATSQIDVNATTTATLNLTLQGHYDTAENGTVLSGLAYP